MSAFIMLRITASLTVSNAYFVCIKKPTIKYASQQSKTFLFVLLFVTVFSYSKGLALDTQLLGVI